MNYSIEDEILTTVTFTKCPDCGPLGRVFSLNKTGQMVASVCPKCYGASMISEEHFLLAPTSEPIDLPAKIPFDFDA